MGGASWTEVVAARESRLGPANPEEPSGTADAARRWRVRNRRGGRSPGEDTTDIDSTRLESVVSKY